MKNNFSKILLITLVFFISCNKVKNKGNELIEKSKKKVSIVSKKAWEKSIKFAFNNLSTSENISLEKIYPDNKLPPIKMIESIKIKYPSNFYSCYFKYESKKDGILNFLSSLKTRLPKISDKKYIKIKKEVFLKKFDFIEKITPNVNNKIEFFKEIKNIKEMEYYRCNKYPNANYIAIDIKNGTIYHLIEKYWD